MVSVRKRNNPKGASLAFVCSGCTASAAGWSPPPPRSGPHSHRTVPPDTSANRAGARSAAGSGQPGSGQVPTDQPGQISRVRLAGQRGSPGLLGSPGQLGPPGQLEPGFLQRLATQCFFFVRGSLAVCYSSKPLQRGLLCVHCLLLPPNRLRPSFFAIFFKRLEENPRNFRSEHLRTCPNFHYLDIFLSHKYFRYFPLTRNVKVNLGPDGG